MTVVLILGATIAGAGGTLLGYVLGRIDERARSRRRPAPAHEALEQIWGWP